MRDFERREPTFSRQSAGGRVGLRPPPKLRPDHPMAYNGPLLTSPDSGQSDRGVSPFIVFLVIGVVVGLIIAGGLSPGPVVVTAPPTTAASEVLAVAPPTPAPLSSSASPPGASPRSRRPAASSSAPSSSPSPTPSATRPPGSDPSAFSPTPVAPSSVSTTAPGRPGTSAPAAAPARPPRRRAGRRCARGPRPPRHSDAGRRLRSRSQHHARAGLQRHDARAQSSGSRIRRERKDAPGAALIQGADPAGCRRAARPRRQPLGDGVVAPADPGRSSHCSPLAPG